MHALAQSVSAGEITPKQTIELNLFCWESLPLRLRRWSWISRGVGNIEMMAKWYGTTEAHVLEDEQVVRQQSGFLVVIYIYINKGCSFNIYIYIYIYDYAQLFLIATLYSHVELRFG